MDCGRLGDADYCVGVCHSDCEKLNGSGDMGKIIRDTTVAEAIDEVLFDARQPVSGREIFENLPVERMVKALSYRQFWQHFWGMQQRKKNKIEKVACPQAKQRRCWCYVIRNHKR